jgi:hypothetical protein
VVLLLKGVLISCPLAMDERGDTKIYVVQAAGA